jgi:sterol desaturase/sphingolipid hydroxylase (fatty acid hydroxylase superfamily)
MINPNTKNFIREKSRNAWVLDGLNLGVQGTIIPFLVAILASSGFEYIVPQLQGKLDVHPILSFYINFIFVDYLYYWNHRFFHHKKIFPIHIVHHTVTQMDVLATSRNTIWTSFFIVYLWVNSFFIFWLKDPSPYILAMSLSACLDMWKHSTALVSKTKFLSFLSRVFCIMTPIEHAWHHSHKVNINYGANLNLFDKIHGTYYDKETYPKSLGLKVKLSYWKKLFQPF